MKRLLSMESVRITSILVLLFTCSTSCFPSRPLNERSADLTWQAWLLVDDQNQDKNYDPEALGRRRITPKSVFIAPTFSPESFPPCASGYQSDPMGRCVKLIEIDQEAHLEFLLQKLNERFGGYDDLMEQESQETVPPPGPLQLNIPLDGSKQDGTSDVEEENIDVAIVVAPTNGNFNLDDDDSLKTSTAKRAGVANADEKQNVGHSKGDTALKAGNPVPSKGKSSTSQESLSTENLQNINPASTASTVLDKTVSTVTEASTAVPSESMPETSTIREQQALFFREPLESGDENTDHTKPVRKHAITDGAPLGFADSDNWQADDTNANRGTTTELSTTFGDNEPHNTNVAPVDGSLQKRAPGEYQQPEPTATPSTIQNTPQKNTVRFPSNTDESLMRYLTFPSHTNLKGLFYKNVPENNEPIEFYEKLPEENQSERPKMYASQFKYLSTTQRYIRPETSNSHSDRFVFKNRDLVADATFQRSLGLQPTINDRLQPRVEQRSINFSKIQRDNNQRASIWSFSAPSLNESSPHKPLVLRFPQRHGSRRLLSEQVLQPLNSGGYKTFFREITPEDLILIFGDKRKRTSNR